MPEQEEPEMVRQLQDVALARSEVAAFRVRLESAESLSDRARILQELGRRLARNYGRVIP